MLDIHRIMGGLSERRPIFHSEADFQRALAWAIRETVPDVQIRLEFNPFPKGGRPSYLDIWLPGLGVALELKYPTRRFATEYDGEAFAVSDHAAQPPRRYDFLKDVQRLERVVREKAAKVGYAIMLTNDSAYWKTPSTHANPIDAAFRIHEGRRVSGSLNWAAHTGKGTMSGRQDAIHLDSVYAMRWRDYSQLAGGGYAAFRYLAVSVAP